MLIYLQFRGFIPVSGDVFIVLMVIYRLGVCWVALFPPALTDGDTGLGHMNNNERKLGGKNGIKANWKTSMLRSHTHFNSNTRGLGID